MSGLESYKFSTKSHWRRWQWNRIAERVKDRRNAFGVILCGKEGLDFAVAESKGFARRNMIAAEIRTDIARDIRRFHGVACANLTLQQLIFAWRGRPIDYIVADTCSNLDGAATLIPAIIYAKHVNRRHVVVSVNIQRGREARAREFIRQESLVEQKLCPRVAPNHRGRAWTDLFLSKLWKIDRRLIFHCFVVSPPPQYSSYRSRYVTMDSAVGGFINLDVLPIEYGDEAEREWAEWRPKISAALAVSTAQKNQAI